MVFPSNEGGTRVISRSIGGRPDSQRASSVKEDDDPTSYGDTHSFAAIPVAACIMHTWKERTRRAFTFSVIFLRPEACCKSSKSWEYEAT